MSNRPADDFEPRRCAHGGVEQSRMDIMQMLNSKTGCDQLQLEVMKFIRGNHWFNIGAALQALEEDTLLICIFSTIYTAKPNGKIYQRKPTLSVIA